jgi:hypothetical protein
MYLIYFHVTAFPSLTAIRAPYSARKSILLFLVLRDWVLAWKAKRVVGGGAMQISMNAQRSVLHKLGRRRTYVRTGGSVSRKLFSECYVCRRVVAHI